MAQLPDISDELRPSNVFGKPDEPHSLFGEILDWMLAPLLFLWPLSIAATNHVAIQIADQPYDRHLTESLAAIVRTVDVRNVHETVDFPNRPWEFVETDGDDITYLQIKKLTSVPSGDVLARRAARAPPGEAMLEEGDISGDEVRVAYRVLHAEGATPVLVRLAETRYKRKQLSSNIISGVLLPQVAIIPLAVLLVYLGLTRGLMPLNRLQKRIRRRRPGDLSPINIHRVPEEMRPVIAAFNEMMVRLEDNLEAQHRFIAAAAHQLKTPLTGLKMQTELALQETDCVALHEYLQRIAVGAEQAAHLTSRLLQLARAEASHDKVHATELVDLNALAREVTESCVPRALAKDIDLGFEAARRPLPIEGVRLLLREMLDNLVDNAIKYTPAGGRVTVRVLAGLPWRIDVEDTGIGIPPEERFRVFERFYRALDAVSAEGIEGSGLGLAIVREIVELHRARIDVLDGSEGRGSLFRITFPRDSRLEDMAADID